MADHGRDIADVLAGIGRHWGWFLTFGIITVLAGVLALVWPGRTVAVVAVLFGLQLVWAGAFRFVAAIAVEGADGATRVLWALLGVLSFLFGLYALRHVLVTVTVLALLLGIFWIVNGLIEIFTALSNPARAGRGWAIGSGLLGVLAGIVVLVYPGISLVTLAVVLGIWLIVYGAMGIVSAFQLRSVGHAATTVRGRDVSPGRGPIRAG
jgi:uncharacterized membrane protein HdeD (DUF308 family)